MPVTLATVKAEIRRIRQIVCEALLWKNKTKHKKVLVEWLKW
jgi:hypothetical protein